MNKGELTREHIIEQAAALFNTKGYTGASMSELMALTGLKKGGIYNHFQSKEEIAVEAFDYSIRLVNQAIYNVTKPPATTGGKLVALVDFYRGYPLNSVIMGGCPILNTTVDADDTNPVLKARVQQALNDWIRGLAAIINKGIREGEFKADIDAEEAAVVIISLIEGGIVMTRNFGDNKYMDVVARQLMNYIEVELKI
jgi:AcrR family transcriptional regulator